MAIVTIVAILSLCVAALSAGIAWYSGTASTKLYVEKKRDPEDEPGTEKWVVVGARRAKERKNASTCSNLLLDKGMPESCARKNVPGCGSGRNNFYNQLRMKENMMVNLLLDYRVVECGDKCKLYLLYTDGQLLTIQLNSTENAYKIADIIAHDELLDRKHPM